MRAARILQRGRRFANSLMTERVIVGTEKRTTDPETGKARIVIEDVIYGGTEGAAGQIQYSGLAVTDSNTTGQSVVEQNPRLKVPTGSPPLPEGQTVRVVSSDADSVLIGRRYRINGAPDAGSTTANRYPLVELS